MFRQLVLLFLITSYCFGQQQDKVDFLRSRILIEPLPLEKEVKGTVVYSFKALSKVDSIFLDAKNMGFTIVKLNGKKVSYSNNGAQITIHKKFKKGRTYALELVYSCKPKQTLYFIGLEDTIEGNEQIWTQGQGKYTSHWVPSFDDMEEKVEFDLQIKTHKSNRVVANGALVNVTKKPDSKAVFSFDMKKPMSSYLLAFVIGKYEKEELTSKSGIPIENYYYPKDSLKVEPTYRYTKQIFDFLEVEIGVPYPWQNYKQIPVKDFLYAGMENTTATIFSDSYMIDATAFVDRNYVNVNAHELAHQWFGNLVTEKNGEHHWLHEGFATYYAYLVEKQLFGDEHFYWKLHDTANQLQDISNRGEGQSLLDPKASSLTFYEKGAWALVALRELVGDEFFKNGIRTYLAKHQFKNVTIADFLKEMTIASTKDLSAYKKMWLDSSEFPIHEARFILEKYSPSLVLLSNMNAEFERIKSDDINYEAYWNTSSSVHFKKHLVEKHHSMLPTSVIEKAFAMDTVPIRQSLAVSLFGMSTTDKNKQVWKRNFESLLNDKSYRTQEVALIKLWGTFEKDRQVYLDKLSNTTGFPNKNIRLLWLTLALVTPDYRVDEKAGYLEELILYTKSIYNPEVRQTAFTFLTDIRAMNLEAFKELLKSTNHHSWQFRNFARRLLDKGLNDDKSKVQIQAATKELKDDDLRYLRTKMKVE